MADSNFKKYWAS